MTEPDLPAVAVVTDQDGVKHWGSRTAPFIRDGLRDGTLTEVNDAPVPTPSPDLDSGHTDDGSGDGQRDAGGTVGGDDDGVAGAATSGSSRKRR